MIKSQQFEIAILITTYHNGKLIKEAIGQILFKAARLNQCDTIDALMQMSGDFFCKAWVANAHLAAMKARRIEAGIRLEEFKNQLDISNTLSSLNPDRQNLMITGQTKSQAQAVGRRNLNHFFQPECELDKGVSPFMLIKPSSVNR